MLVLTRKQHENLVIGDNVQITVLAISGNRVRLGITAPDSVEVYRAELCFEGVGRDQDFGNQTAAAQKVPATCR